MGAILHLGIGIVAIAFAIFQAQPPPPQSPLLYQWKTFEGHETKFKDFTIFYKDIIGNVRNNETLLILHGYPTSSFDYHLLINAFKNTFGRIVLVDFLGFGYSDKPRNYAYTIGEQASIVEDVLKKTKVMSFHVLAHDYGSSVAQELLARRSHSEEEIKSVGFISGNFFPTVYRIPWSQYFHKMNIFGPIFTRFANEWSFGKTLNGVLGQEHQLESYEIKSHWFFARHKDGYRRWTQLLKYLDERIEHETRWMNVLQKPKIPICTFYGDQDSLNPSPDYPDMYKHLIPNPCIKVLENVGHYPHLENPVLFMKYYIEFLQTFIHVDTTLTKVVVPDKIPRPIFVSEEVEDHKSQEAS